jgi:hypothetical protein
MSEKNRSDRVLEVAHSSPGPTDTRVRACPQCRSADLLALARILRRQHGDQEHVSLPRVRQGVHAVLLRAASIGLEMGLGRCPYD